VARKADEPIARLAKKREDAAMQREKERDERDRER
jgi:hypothetical protein